LNAPQDDEAAEPVILENDDQDTVAQTRPLPEAEPSEQERSTPDQLPTIGFVGRYALKYCIGEGGLGTVYAAHDPLLSRLIAIKTMQVNMSEQDRVQFNALFLNEAKAAGSLSHPHIVTVFDAGAGSQGTYMAMELLRGKDLRQLLSIGWRPTPAQAALIVRRVADALSYAHHKGVIHRDIKPANIFMVGRTQPRVLDFGIARIRQAESETSPDGLSRFSELVGGSPYYMAPEQVNRQPVDRRVDVYALGVVLYELLTGKRPYSGSDVDEIAQEVLTKTVRPPHEINPEVPQALSEIAMRAMSRDLVQRTRSARTLSQELREWLDGQSDAEANGKSAKGAKVDKPGKAIPKAAPSVSPAAKPGAPASGEGKKTGILIGAGVAALALLGGIGWVGWQQSQKGPAALPVAVEPKPAEDIIEPATRVAAAPKPVAPAASASTSANPFDSLNAAPAAPSAAGASAVVTAASAAAPVVVPPVAVAPVAVVQPPALKAVPAPNPAALARPQGNPPVLTAPPVTPPVAAVPAKPTVAATEVKALPSGTVRFEVSPWGRVFVDNRAMGVAPPMTQLSLPQGRHTITIRNDDSPPYSQTVVVRPGQSVTVSHSF
jgi:cytoskeletal protein RodZ